MGKIKGYVKELAMEQDPIGSITFGNALVREECSPRRVIVILELTPHNKAALYSLEYGDLVEIDLGHPDLPEPKRVRRMIRTK